MKSLNQIFTSENVGFDQNQTRSYRFGFNGMENLNEVTGSTGSHLDFGARIYDSRVGRWMTIDPLAAKFNDLSPYNFVANMPTIAIDINGEDIFILIYVKDNSGLFKSAAETRGYAIKKYENYDSEKDKVVLIEVSDISDISVKVKETVDKYSGTYGKTVEAGVWSHSGKDDGPIGNEKTSKDALGSNQMTLEGWGKIDWNWKDDPKAQLSFYGCNSANPFSKNFTRKISAQKNVNVEVRGQITSSYPSTAVDERIVDSRIEDEVHAGYRRYLVASKNTYNDRLGFQFNDAEKMHVWKNNVLLRSEYQDGYNADGKYSRSFWSYFRKKAESKKSNESKTNGGSETK